MAKQAEEAGHSGDLPGGSASLGLAQGPLAPDAADIDRLLCIFPFEEAFFREHGIAATYIGHPLTRLVRASASGLNCGNRFGIPAGPAGRLVARQPDGRNRAAPARLVGGRRTNPDASRTARFILALPEGSRAHEFVKFSGTLFRASIQVLEGETWDVLACADLALAASGTVTVEACLLGTPMVTFYRVNRLSWLMGRLLVRVPFYSMVNLVAGRRVVPELIQSD